MIFKYLLILLAIIFYLEIQAQRKWYQLDSIIHIEKFTNQNTMNKIEYRYLDNDSLAETIYYYFDSSKNNFIPTYSYKYYDINPYLFYYSSFTWDAAQNKMLIKDSFKVVKKINQEITFDSSFVLTNGQWKFYYITKYWHNFLHYGSKKRYDSIKSQYIDSNRYEYDILYRYDEFGRDTLSWQKRMPHVSDIIYKKVYDDSSRLSELYYANKPNQYYLREKLSYNNDNLSQVDFNFLSSTGTGQKGTYVYFQYHQEFKLENCNFRYSNEYYRRPFKSVPVLENLPWDTTNTRYERRKFYYSKTKAYSGLGKTENSLIRLYLNPNKGRVRHTSLEPLRLYFYTIDGRKIEETRLEANEDYQLRNYSQNMVIVEAYNLKGEKQFSEKLVLE